MAHSRQRLRNHRQMKRILLIDDDSDDSLLLQEALREVFPDIAFQHAENGKIALLQLANGNNLPDLVFLDINIPQLSGWEVLKRIKQIRAMATVPIYMFTTSASNREREMATILGATGFITKPRSFETLLTVVRDTLLPYLHV